MVHEIFDTNAIVFDDYVQIGRGLDEAFPIYRGGPVFQRGTGIGDVFRGVLRFFMPLIRHAGVALRNEALNTGHRIIEQVKEGQPLKQALIEESKKGFENVTGVKQFGGGQSNLTADFSEPSESLIPTDSSGMHRLSPRYGRRTIKRRRSNPLSHQTVISSKITKPIVHSTKRLRSDVFGLY
jgi:hypothetical protein